MIKVDWGDYEETLLVVKILGAWTLNEYRQAANIMLKLIATKSHTVHLLVDMQIAASAPPNIIPVAVSDLRNRPPNYGKLIVIARNPIWSKIWDITRRIHQVGKLDIYFVDTANDAYSLVVEDECQI